MESTIQVLALEPRIKGRSVPFRLEGVGSRGNFSCLEVAVQCGGLVSRTCLFYWGCSAAAWQWSWPILGWFGFSHFWDDFQNLQRGRGSKSMKSEITCATNLLVLYCQLLTE